MHFRNSPSSFPMLVFSTFQPVIISLKLNANVQSVYVYFPRFTLDICEQKYKKCMTTIKENDDDLQ